MRCDSFMKIFKPTVFGLTTILMLSLMVGSSFAASTTITGPIIKNVKVGQEFTIVLPTNPSTGYNWKANYNSKYLKLIKQTYQPNTPILIGSGGNEVFTFKALKSGETLITLNYQRSGSKPIQIKEYKLKIIKNCPKD